MQVAVAGTGDELTRAEARCVHCGAPGSIRDFLKEGQYCSPQCAEVNARKYVWLMYTIDFENETKNAWILWPGSVPADARKMPLFSQ